MIWYQLIISPTVEMQITIMKIMQIELIAVMADGWLFTEMKFLKSFKFLRSSVSVLVAY